MAQQEKRLSTVTVLFITWILAVQLTNCRRHYAMDEELWNAEQQKLACSARTENLTDDDYGTCQALYVLEAMDKKRFKAIFPIRMKNTQIERGQVLGDGSFGIVYIARVAKNNNKLAVKASNKVGYTKIEYDALKTFNSRYFPKAYFFGVVKFGASNAVAFFGMEILRGADIFQLMVHYDSPMSGEYLRYVSAQLLVAISQLHAKGYIHRDIKPENIMCCSNGNIKVIDFGGCLVAKDDKKTFNEWFGTEEYMAPEQHRCVSKGTKNCSYTRLVDWWAAGATIHYAATFHDLQKGKPVHTGDANLSDLINKLCSQNPSARKFNYRKHPYFKGFNWKKTN